MALYQFPNRTDFLRRWRQEDNRKGYQWPASAITASEMAKLAEARATFKRPISKLLREAVASQQFIPVLNVKQV